MAKKQIDYGLSELEAVFSHKHFTSWEEVINWLGEVGMLDNVTADQIDLMISDLKSLEKNEVPYISDPYEIYKFTVMMRRGINDEESAF